MIVNNSQLLLSRSSLVAQLIKNLTAMRETWVQSHGFEDPPEKGKATYSSILGWRIPWTEEPGALQSVGSQRVGHEWATTTNIMNISCYSFCSSMLDMGFLVAQMVKNLTAMRETWVRSLGWEDPLKKGTTTYSSIRAWRIPWTEEAGRLQSMGSQSRTWLSD